MGHSGGGALTGGATEFTQMANNALLSGQLSEQITMVAETTQSRITQANQYATMTQNLRQIQPGDLSRAFSPYEVAQFEQLLGSIRALEQSANTVRNVVDRRGTEYERSGFSDPAKYLAYERALADQRGGVYKQRLDQDIAALDGMRQRHQEFTRVMQRTSSVTGNVEGLQHLAQVSAMTTGELMEIKAAILSQNVEANLGRVTEQHNTHVRSGLYERAMDSAKTRKQQEGGSIAIDPNRAWDRMLGSRP